MTKSIIDGSVPDVVYYAVSRRSRQNENTDSCNNSSHRRNDDGTHRKGNGVSADDIAAILAVATKE